MNFDLLAPHYLWIEQLVFGQSLQKCRTAHVPFLNRAKKALIVGEGNGRFLKAFLTVNRTVQIDCLDLSPKMLEIARRRIAVNANDLERVAFHSCDVRTEDIPGKDYDLIVTNFLLDCFNESELRIVIDRLTEVSANQSQWLIGDFRLPSHGARRRRAVWQLKIMYACFRIATHLLADSLVDPAPFMKEKGFKIVSECSWQEGFLSSQLWQRERDS
jgi:SAM-dependent methyltransferase